MTVSQVEKTRNSGILTGILGGFLGRSVSLLAPFIVMPAMLHYLGGTIFGIWMTAVSLTSMALFVDFGIGNGLLTRLSAANGRADYAEMRSYIASAYVALFLIALLLLCVLGIVGLSLYWGIFTSKYVDSASLSVFVVCFTIFFLGVPVSVIQRVMYAKQQAWLSNAWQVCGAILSVVLCLLAIRATLAPWLVILAYSLPPIFIMCLSSIFYFIKNVELRPKLSNFSSSNTKNLLHIGTHFFILSIITSISLNVDNVIIAHQLGGAAVTEYAVPAKLASLLGLVVTTLFLPLWAAYGEAVARSDYIWIRRTTLKMSFYGGSAVFVLAVTMVALSGILIELWMGRSFHAQTTILIFLSSLSVLMAISSPSQMLLNSVGKVGIQVKAWLCFLIVSVLLKYCLLGYLDIWILPLINSLTYLVCILPVVLLTSKNIINNRSVS